MNATRIFLLLAAFLALATTAASSGAEPALDAAESKALKRLDSLQSDAEKIAELEKFCSTEDAKAASHYNLGCLYARVENYKAAAESFDRALQLAPAFASAAKNLVLALEASGAPADELLPRLNGAISLCGLQDTDLLAIAARTYLKRSDYSSALEACRLGSICGGGRAESFRNTAAEILIRTGEFQKAAEDLNFMLSQNPKNPRAWDLLLACHVRSGNYIEAAAVWEAAEKFGCRPAGRSAEAAGAYYKLGLYEDCAGVCKSMKLDSAADAETTLMYARALSASGSHTLAEELCDKIYKAENSSRASKISALERKLESFISRNAPPEECAKLAETLISLNPESPAANFALANRLKDGGNFRAAMLRFDACAKNPRYKRAALMRKAACMLSLSDKNGAIDLLVKLNEESPSAELSKYIEILKSGK